MNVSILLVILLAGALITYFSSEKSARQIALFVSLVAFTVTGILLSQYQSGVSVDVMAQWISNPNISFYLKADGLSLALVLLTSAVTPLVIFSSFGNSFENKKTLYALILFMAFAMTGTFLAADGFLYYIFWELSLIPIYFIGLLWGNGDAELRKQTMIRFFIYTFAGSLFMLVAFIFLYQKAGSFLLEDLYALNLTSSEQFWVFLAFFLAYAIKIPIVPFHSWQADTYQANPALGTMLLSGVMLKMALFSLIRWQIPITPDAAAEHKNFFIVLSIIGVIYGSILALRQDNIKRLLAYSSLAHVALIAAGTYTLTLDGFRGAVLQMLAHGFVIVGLFFAAEIIERRFGTQKISEMGGIRSQAVWFASVFMILVMASVGLPGTFNFIGEFTLLYGLSQENIWFAIFGGTSIILGAFYMLRMFQHSMLGETNTKVFADINVQEKVIFVIIVVVLIFFGLYPKPLNDLIVPALEETLKYIN
ncbi:MAG: NADH-quinone oxidoreductase subunit M [Flavobacteriaceae bacterium]|nr:NADH-quinone oxidoreductase subunit M [Flavobacteriaceae bacterium]